ncbi:MAG: hypothetical protein DCF28_10340 [Alphaproteobacteria bacterium]|nr:MAG: hypothetical protein DCF28_10340 [Alphaproteobacteria bacterium]PZO33964.1 MAG: hypothetical protein DCE92_12250 [Alphaproteobacteria bacterium]
MAGLSVAHLATLAQMIERIPDDTLQKLSGVILSMPGDKAVELSRVLADETRDRKRRCRVLKPIIPLFRPRADGVAAVQFPPAVLPRLWKAASAKEQAFLGKLDNDPLTGRPVDPATAETVAARICLAAAAAVRDQPDIIWPDDGTNASERQAGLAALAGICDLAPLAARGLPALMVWIGRPNEDQLAELRLLVRDAAAVAPEGAQRLLEILFAHLDDPSRIFRLVVHASTATGREIFLFDSELAVFVTRLIKTVEDRVARISTYRGDGGPDPFAVLRDDIAWCATVLTELDLTIQMQPGGVWGKQARDARLRVNATLHKLLSKAEATVEKALPTAKVQGTGRIARTTPMLDTSVPAEAREAALASLALVRASRASASVFGSETLRYNVLQSLTDRLATYADQALDRINRNDVNNVDEARQIVLMVADFLTTLEAIDEAKTVRRRVAVAGVPVGHNAPSRGAA